MKSLQYVFTHLTLVPWLYWLMVGSMVLFDLVAIACLTWIVFFL